MVALMTGDAINRITGDLDICQTNTTGMANETNGSMFSNVAACSAVSTGNSSLCDYDECQQKQISIAITLSFLVGLLMVSGKGEWRGGGEGEGWRGY